MGNSQKETKLLSFIPQICIEGQGDDAQELFQALEISSKDVNILFTKYYWIEGCNSDYISLQHLFDKLSVSNEALDHKIFSVFDDTKSGKLSFMVRVFGFYFLKLSTNGVLI